MLDKDRLLAGLAAFIVALIVASQSMVPVIFAEPPPNAKALLRAYIEKTIAALAAWGAGWLSAPWAAEALNQVIVKFTPLTVKVDAVSAGVAVGVLVAVLVADPTARDRLRAWVGRKINGVLK